MVSVQGLWDEDGFGEYAGHSEYLYLNKCFRLLERGSYMLSDTAQNIL